MVRVLGYPTLLKPGEAEGSVQKNSPPSQSQHCLYFPILLLLKGTKRKKGQYIYSLFVPWRFLYDNGNR